MPATEKFKKILTDRSVMLGWVHAKDSEQFPIETG